MSQENVSVWLSLSSDDFIPAIKAEVDFLYQVSRYPLLYTPGPVLNNAIRRYETLFLPAIVKTSRPVCETPLDIQWIWHCHMLAPAYYHRDCEKMISTVPDHTINPPPAAVTVQSVWSQHVPENEPFEVDPLIVTEFTGGPNDALQSSYDLVGAVQRQSALYYNVSLPHYKDDNFLFNAINRYKMMLQLKTFHLNAFLVPCYDMNLAWHTHKLHPYFYKNDTTEYLGKIFDQDDSMMDRGPESQLSKLEEETKQLWKEAYDEPMALSGAMYRGVSLMGKLGQLTHAEILDEGNFRVLVVIESEAHASTSYPRGHLRLDVGAHDKSLYWHKGKRTKYRFSTKFSFYNSWDKIDLLEERTKTLTFTLYEIRRREGCFGSPPEVLGSVPIHLEEFVTLDQTEAVKFRKEVVFDCYTLNLAGHICAPTADGVFFVLEPGPFYNEAMPVDRESLWGPIPLRRLPDGSVNHCSVANHTFKRRIFGIKDRMTEVGAKATLFAARVIHCQPLLMSCVQIFHEDKMVGVSHLVETDQIPKSTSKVIKDLKDAGMLKINTGERAMLIKTADGDRMVVFGRWANVKQAIPGPKKAGGTPGEPGNLQIRISKVKSDNRTWEEWVYNTGKHVYSSIIDVSPTNNPHYFFMANDVTAQLSTGEIGVKPSTKIPEKLCLALSIGVLTCLCQPPPPGIEPPKDANVLGLLPPPRKYVGIKNGGRYNDGAIPPLVTAAGWLMPTPSNYYIQNHWIHGDRDCQDHAKCTACVDGCSGDG